MTRYATTVLVLGTPVMCDTFEAPSAAEARAIAEHTFWSGPDDLRAELPAMDELNRTYATRFLSLMDETRDSAKRHGITITSRPSRARV
jgi:hypothetical protein